MNNYYCSVTCVSYPNSLIVSTTRIRWSKNDDIATLNNLACGAVMTLYMKNIERTQIGMSYSDEKMMVCNIRKGDICNII